MGKKYFSKKSLKGALVWVSMLASNALAQSANTMPEHEQTFIQELRLGVWSDDSFDDIVSFNPSLEREYIKNLITHYVINEWWGDEAELNHYFISQEPLFVFMD